MESIVATRMTSSSWVRVSRAVPIWQRLANAWTRHLELHVERAVISLDHPGVADDYRRAASKDR
jgi:hypothetical protein